MVNLDFIGIPFSDISDQILDLILYFYYTILHPEIRKMSKQGIQHVTHALYYLYPYKLITTIELMDFPYDKIYSTETCTELIYGKYRITERVMVEMKEYMKSTLYAYDINSHNIISSSVISLSELPFTVPKIITHDMIISTLDLYHY